MAAKSDPPYRSTEWPSQSVDQLSFGELFKDMKGRIGWNLANRRREAHLSRGELSAPLGLTEEKLRLIEFGESEPTIELLFAASLYLEQPLQLFFSRAASWGCLEHEDHKRFCNAVSDAIKKEVIQESDVTKLDPGWKRRLTAPVGFSRLVTGALEIAGIAGIDLVPFLPDTFDPADLVAVAKHNRERKAPAVNPPNHRPSGRRGPSSKINPGIGKPGLDE